MNALILSVSAGGGHVQAAVAVKNSIKAHYKNSHVQIFDTIKHLNPLLDKLVIGGYLRTIKITPSIFGKLYEYTYNDIPNISNKINEQLANKLLPLIDEVNPDIIIATHFFPTEMLSILKSKYKIHIPVVAIITDYATHNIWIHPNIDAYIVADHTMVEEIALKGIPKETIYPYGIPINSNFMTQHNRESTLNDIGLSPEKPTIMIMGGSLGMGNILDLYEKLCSMKTDIQIILIAGKNKKLYEEASKFAEKNLKPTKILGFTNDISKYMQASDLLITKPGGLTITEAIASKIPMAIFSPIPGQEERNAEFLLKHGLAIDLVDLNNCAHIVESLLSNTKSLIAMKKNCELHSNPNCNENTLNLFNSLIEQNFAAISNKS